MMPLSVSKPERQRAREFQSDREASVGHVVPGEYGRLFAQYVADTGAEGGYASVLSGRLENSDVETIDALFEQLQWRLNDVSQWPLQMSLYLPRLGRINVRASQACQSWDIDLEAQESKTSVWLAGVRKNCEDRLSREFDLPVSLRLVPVESI